MIMAAAAALLVLASPGASSWPDPFPSAVRGELAVGIGDVDGDGFGDLLVADPDADDGRGAARVCFGNEHGVTATCAGETVGSVADARWGSTIAALGDVDGDEVPDWLVGSPSGDPTGGGRGAALIYFGPISRDATGAHRAPFALPAEPGTMLGAGAAAAGDVDHDGYADVLVSDASGRVRLYRGGAPTPQALVLWSESAEGHLDGFGTAGDLDGDGYGDVWIARDGVVRQYRGGPTAPWLSTVATEVLMSGPVAWVGDVDGEGRSRVMSMPDAAELVGVGDMNADGFADAVALRDAGVTIYLGGPDGLREVRTLPGQWARVAAAGDVDNDGFADVIVAQGWTVNVIHGRGTMPSEDSSQWEKLGTIASFASAAQGPTVVAGIGDHDSDGLDDVAVTGGDPHAKGKICVVTGSKRDCVEGHDGDALSRVIGAGDLDGDGEVDLVVASPDRRTAEGDPVRSKVEFILHRRAGAPVIGPQIFTGDADGDRFGESLAALGDVNGDGYADVGVGAPGGDPPYVVIYAGHIDGVRELTRLVIDPTGADEAGWVGGPGDLDADGLSDIVIGAPGIGRAFIRWGREGAAPATTSSQVLWPYSSQVAVPEPDPALRLGTPVTGLAPAFGGERARLLVAGSGCTRSVWSDTTSPTPAWGRVACWPRMDRTGPEDYGLYGGFTLDEADGCYGWTVAGAGDVDGDGLPDMVVGAPYSSFGDSPRTGRVWIYRGSETACPASQPAWSVAGRSAWVRFGSSVAGVGDVDGDGFADVAVVEENNQGQLQLLWGNSQFGRSFATQIRPWRVVGDRVQVPPGGLTGLPGDMTPGQAADPRRSVIMTGVGRSPFGPAELRLEVEVKPWNVPFDGLGLVEPPWKWVADKAGGTLTAEVGDLLPGRAYRWRARVAHRLSAAPLQGAGHWTVGGHPMTASGIHFRTLEDQPPVALRRRLVVSENGAVQLGPAGLLTPAADGPVTPTDAVTDPDDRVETLVVLSYKQPGRGVVTAFGEGRLEYRPIPDTWGPDHFEYQVCDPWGGCSWGDVDVEVTPEHCPGATVERCEAGDFFVVIEMEDGSLRSARCYIDAEGVPQCIKDVSGRVLLGPPACGLDE
ncbi:MAG: FG-GAP repeat protein [Deltaproteobacteria bacterium]|nr:FG-GAP repeat protein [Deltaproteobacteria bacterium]